MSQEKLCLNCKYGRQHYIIHNTAFIKVNNAFHCANKKVSKRQFEQHFENKTLCADWESNVSVKADRRRKINMQLQEVSVQLNYIAQILEEDCKD